MRHMVARRDVTLIAGRHHEELTGLPLSGPALPKSMTLRNQKSSMTLSTFGGVSRTMGPSFEFSQAHA